MNSDSNKNRILELLKILLNSSSVHPITLKKLQDALHDRGLQVSHNTLRDDIHAIQDSGVKVEFIYGINGGWYISDDNWLRSRIASWKLVYVLPKLPGYESHVVAKCSRCDSYLSDCSTNFSGLDSEGRTIIWRGHESRDSALRTCKKYPIDLFPKHCSNCGARNISITQDSEDRIGKE